MIKQEQLQELLSYEGSNVLSLYLDTDCTQESMETIKLQVRGMIKEMKLSQEEGAEAIEKYLDHSYDWSQPGLAIFASRDGQFFRDYPTAVSFRNRLRVGSKPYIKPLVHLIDHYAHYGVIMVDRVGVRFFEYHLGELQTTTGSMGEDVQKLKKGGGSSAVGMRAGGSGARREEEVVQRNLRDAAAAAGNFFAKKPIRRLFVGGTAATVGQFTPMLPKQLQSCLAGTFTLDMTAGEHEVRRTTLELLNKANVEREHKLVEQMVTTQAKGGNAVIGLDDTLQAVSEKRVQSLIISDGFRSPGYVHQESAFVTANLARSPLSDQEMTEIEDVVDAAVALTMSQGGHVEIISNNPELEGAGRIGAILRY
jgi:peptide subunit release factor 1 (eRF1)